MGKLGDPPPHQRMRGEQWGQIQVLGYCGLPRAAESEKGNNSCCPEHYRVKQGALSNPKGLHPLQDHGGDGESGMGWYSSLASLSFNTLENLSQVWHLSNVGIWEVMGDLQLTSMSRWSFRTVLADPDMPQSNKGGDNIISEYGPVLVHEYLYQVDVAALSSWIQDGESQDMLNDKSSTMDGEIGDGEGDAKGTARN